MNFKHAVERALRHSPTAFRAASRIYYTLNRSFMTLSPGAPEAIAQALQCVKDRGQPARGDYYEFGVFRGYTLWRAYEACQALGLTQMRCYGFDSFQGLPVPTAEDETEGKFFEGQFACSKDGVVQWLTQRGVDWSRVVLIEGFFNETLTPQVRQRYPFGPVAVAFIDCDLYSSTRQVLAWLGEGLVDGSIVLFDDWRTLDSSSQGQQRAWREFTEAHPGLRAAPFVDFSDHGTSFVISNVSTPPAAPEGGARGSP